MKQLKSFLKTTTLGGFLAILPLAILLIVAQWLWSKLAAMLQPVTSQVTRFPPHNEIVGDILAIALLLIACFLIGLLVKTSLGSSLFRRLETGPLKKLPGYFLIKETVGLFSGTNSRPFSTVAIVRVFENSTLMTAFVTDTHDDGSYTVFVPTGPNPMSGNIYHLEKDAVRIVNASVEEAMRSIVSCGAGSNNLLATHSSG